MQGMSPAGHGAPLPEHLAPMLATLGTLPPESQDAAWAYEMKWDGVRALARIDGTVKGRQVRLLSRNDIDMAVSYPELATLGAALRERRVLLDGEIVCLDAQGRPSFRRLQKRMHVGDPGAAAALAASDPVVLLVFDLLHLDGRSLLGSPYTERREQLESLGLAATAWQTPPAFAGSGAEAVRVSKDQQLEGIVAKRITSRYTPGRRSPDWVKVKNLRTQEVVIGGWTPGNGRRAGMIGALLLGIPDGDQLAYLGKVGTGFTDGMLRDLAADLEPLHRDTSPFRDVPRADARNVSWVLPRLVGEVAFSEWTGDGRLRHPAWRGARPDKTAAEVVRES
jgi:bifunctional non-homologous end joining protein LigD